MPPNDDLEIYLGTWCAKEEENLRNFFAYYFRNSLTNRKNFPQNRTIEQWQEQYQAYKESKS